MSHAAAAAALIERLLIAITIAVAATVL